MSSASLPESRVDDSALDVGAHRVPRQRRGDQYGVIEGDLVVPVAAPRPRPTRVVETELPAPAVEISQPGAVRRPPHRRRYTFAVQVGIVLAAGLAVASVASDPRAGVAVLLFSLALKYHSGPLGVRAGPPSFSRLVTDLALPFAAVALGVTFGWLPSSGLRSAAAVLVVVNGADLAARLWRQRLEGPARVIVVGDRGAIESASNRWASHPQVVVAGGLLLSSHGEGECSENDATRVRGIRSLGEVAHWAERWGADLVMLARGSGATSAEVRTLTWDLERIDVSLALSGMLDSAAPHRIESSRFAGATLVHTRSSRPSVYIRVAKWTIDRVLGTLLLVLAAPVIALCCVCIRRGSAGPGLFKQIRIGQGGRPFTMYKLRTMHSDAEAAKAALGGGEGGAVLFKLFDDPRVTRIGTFLRKSSMDELPQLINVALGQMSLVGPRPALPGEVETYDDLARRRMAVRPGMTGLWQVSGRSDLGWAESVELDVHYTDNYRLTDDLLIGLRTVRAVLGSKGAY